MNNGIERSQKTAVLKAAGKKRIARKHKKRKKMSKPPRC